MAFANTVLSNPNTADDDADETPASAVGLKIAEETLLPGKEHVDPDAEERYDPPRKNKGGKSITLAHAPKNGERPKHKDPDTYASLHVSDDRGPIHCCTVFGHEAHGKPGTH